MSYLDRHRRTAASTRCADTNFKTIVDKSTNKIVVRLVKNKDSNFNEASLDSYELYPSESILPSEDLYPAEGISLPSDEKFPEDVLSEQFSINTSSKSLEGYQKLTIYSEKEYNMELGDYFLVVSDGIFNNVVFLIVKEEKNVYLSSKLDKFIAISCNIKAINNNFITYGAYVRNVEEIFKESTENVAGMQYGSYNKDSLFIATDTSNLDIDDRISIRNTMWEVQEFNGISNFPIKYFTIHNIPVVEYNKEVDTAPDNKYYSGGVYTFQTHEYYFKSNTPCEIISKKESEVSIRIPRYVKNMILTTKDDNNNLVEVTIAIGD